MPTQKRRATDTTSCFPPSSTSPTREVDGAMLIKALAAALNSEKEKKAAEFILGSMSQRLAQQMRDEMEALGTVKAKDGEEAISAVVTAIREMEAKGEIILVAEDE